MYFIHVADVKIDKLHIYNYYVSKVLMDELKMSTKLKFNLKHLYESDLAKDRMLLKTTFTKTKDGLYIPDVINELNEKFGDMKTPLYIYMIGFDIHTFKENMEVGDEFKMFIRYTTNLDKT